MQSMLNIRATHGIPLCLSGIINPLALSLELADHENRRQAMRKQRSLTREVMLQNQEMGSFINSGREFLEVMKGETNGDLDDLSTDHLGLTAKAA